MKPKATKMPLVWFTPQFRDATTRDQLQEANPYEVSQNVGLFRLATTREQ